MFAAVDTDFERRVRDSFASQTVMKTFGAEMTALAAGKCEITMPFQPHLCQQDGFLHAGVVTTISDSAAGYAAFTLMPPGSSVLTIEYKQNLMSPAVGERLIARAEVVRSGRNISVVTSHAYMVRDGHEKEIGLLLATMMCLRKGE